MTIGDNGEQFCCGSVKKSTTPKPTTPTTLETDAPTTPTTLETDAPTSPETEEPPKTYPPEPPTKQTQRPKTTEAPPPVTQAVPTKPPVIYDPCQDALPSECRAKEHLCDRKEYNRLAQKYCQRTCKYCTPISK
ncbi:hypothetical protein M3Y97_01002900 [Aphelenchoides bicaudatus]|nr:hypothetical protein M3Y97_01002900 [Aphelenchoides bicaudatus]